MVYLVKGPKFVHRRHLNQIKKKRHSNIEENNRPEEKPMGIIFDTFDMLATPNSSKSKEIVKKKTDSNRNNRT